MAEIISKDRVPYKIWDKVNGVWNKLNFNTNAKSVDADDGNNLEDKIGAIQGITSSLATDNSNYALSASAGKTLQDKINTHTHPFSQISGLTFSLSGTTLTITKS